jgi:DNA repair exonuclease SbcCD ATPase subunit
MKQSPATVKEVVVEKEEEEEEEEELEMTSYSTSVPADQTDLLAILNSEVFPTPFGHNLQILNQQSVGGGNSNNEEVIELYSTIAMLKKDNNDLLKEAELQRASKDAHFTETQRKLEQQINNLKKELLDSNNSSLKYQQEFEQYKREIQTLEQIQNELEAALHDKDDMIQQLQVNKHQDQNTLKIDYNHAKSEINKLRMEIAASRSSQEKLMGENAAIQNELSYLHTEHDKMIGSHQNEIQDIKSEKRKLEDQVTVYCTIAHTPCAEQ